MSDVLDLERIPSCLAWSLQALDTEYHPVLKLWRLCEAAEFLLRFCVAAGAAVLRVRENERGLTRLARKIERPTQGDWLEMARSLPDALGEDPLLSGLVRSISEQLAPLFSRGRQDYATELLSLWNLLSHGMGMNHRTAEDLLPGHSERLANALRALPWLPDLQLVSFDEDREPVLLAGTTPGGRACAPAIAPSLSPAREGKVFLVHQGTALSLWPLLAYVRPETTPPGQKQSRRGPRPVMAIYSRRERDRLHLSALGSHIPVAELRTEAVDAFVSWFRIDERRWLEPYFELEFQKEAAQFVAREEAHPARADRGGEGRKADPLAPRPAGNGEVVFGDGGGGVHFLELVEPPERALLRRTRSSLRRVMPVLLEMFGDARELAAFREQAVLPES